MSSSKKPSRSSSRATRTKAELKKEFDDVRSTSAREVEQDPAATAARSARAALVKEATQGLTPEAAAKKILTAKLEAGRALDAVAEELIAKTDELSAVREAIEIQTKELEELHGKEVIASSFAVMLEEYDAKENELKAKIAEVERTYTKKYGELELSYNELAEDKKTEHDRAEAEYQYTLQQKRKAQLDTFAEEDRQRGIKEADRQRELQLNWATREANLKAQEQELATLRAQVAAFPAELSSAVKREVAIAENTLKKDHKHEIDMLKAGHAAIVAGLEAEKKVLGDNADQLRGQVTKLNEQLAIANSHIQKISSDALTSASGQSALSAVQQMLQNGGPQTKPAKA